MELSEARKKIDEIDAELSELFLERMNASAQIAQYKKENNLPIFNAEREREILEKVCGKSSEITEKYMRGFYEKIFELSRAYQEELTEK